MEALVGQAFRKHPAYQTNELGVALDAREQGSNRGITA